MSKKTTKRRNNGIGYCFFNLIFNVLETVLIGAGLLAIFLYLTRSGIINYSINSSPMELFISFISGALILGIINFKMQKSLLNSFKKQVRQAFLSGKQKGRDEGFQEGLKKGEAELLKKSQGYINSMKRIK